MKITKTSCKNRKYLLLLFSVEVMIFGKLEGQLGVNGGEGGGHNKFVTTFCSLSESIYLCVKTLHAHSRP